MAFPLAAIGAIGGLLGGIAGLKSANQQKKATNQQGQIARSQQGLFNQASPNYLDLLQMARAHAGIGQHAPGGLAPGNWNQNPYMSPTDKLRLLQANENISRNTDRAQDQLSFNLGRRGLAGSSMDVAGRAAILADAERQRGGFERQLAINAPREMEQRMGFLANLLNPGLSGGQLASNTYGNQAAQAGTQVQQAGGNIGGTLQNLAYLQALQQLNRPTPATPPFVPGAGPYGVSPLQVPNVTPFQRPNYGLSIDDFFGG